jgi:hypothetical protein
MYVAAPLLKFTHVNHQFKLSTVLFSMEAMTCTTDERLYKNAANDSAATKE